MTTLTHRDYGTRYDWNLLRPWLQEQGIKHPEDIQSIDVHPNGKVTLNQYRRSDDGTRLVVTGDEVAMRPPRRIKPTRPIPLLR